MHGYTVKTSEEQSSEYDGETLSAGEQLYPMFLFLFFFTFFGMAISLIGSVLSFPLLHLLI